jgi:hypothetical protein
MERVNPRFHMGKQMERIPISIWGSPYRNGSPFSNGDHSVTNPFPNRVHAHLGIEVKITIWECFPYGDHHFHLVITVRKWAGRLDYSQMGNPRFGIEFVSIWGSTYIYKNILLLDKFNFVQVILFVQDVIFHFYLVLTIIF